MRRLALILLLLAVAGLTAAQPAEPSEALTAQLDDLEADAAAIRGLTLDAPVERIFPAREDIAAFVAGQLDDEEARAYYADAGRLYESFDLLPPGTDLVAVLQALLEAQIGGYYDPETKQMNTLLITGGALADRLPLLEQIVYVHEFTHALQDDNFDLAALMGGDDDLAFAEDFPDEALARQALVEGDATEVMTQYAMLVATERPAEVLRELAALTSLVSTLEIPPGTPDILEQELTFPYVQGQVFVQRLLEEGGWSLVNAAYASPPVSTEQIINPTKYIEGDMPHEIDLPDVSSALDNGWTEQYHRTAGEFFLRRYLETQLPTSSVVPAAGGWGGDLYRYYVNDEMQQTAWIWRLSWDTPEDAAQFDSALLAFLESRYGGQSGDFSLCWQNEQDAMCVGKVGDDALLVKAPGKAQASAMRDLAVGAG